MHKVLQPTRKDRIAATSMWRGGSWHVTSDSWRSSFRKPYAADYRGISIGFHIVRTAE